MSNNKKHKRKIRIGRAIPLVVGIVVLFMGCFLWGYYGNNEDADFISDVKTLFKIEDTTETVLNQGESAENNTEITEESDLPTSEVADKDTLPALPTETEALKEFLSAQVTPEGMITEAIPAKEPPPAVKGVYVTGPVAGHPRMEEIIQLVDETELNAVVIDVKNDEGYITYSMSSETVEALGATVKYVKDMPALVERLHEKGIYVIARVVAFRDPYLAEAKPEWSVHKTNGSIYYDNSGLAWVNPYKRDVWDYLVEVATCAAED